MKVEEHNRYITGTRLCSMSGRLPPYFPEDTAWTHEHPLADRVQDACR